MYATHTIAQPKNKREIKYPDGNTTDIIKTILWADAQPEHRNDLKDFAGQFRERDIEKTLYNVWKWVRQNVKYVLDPLGEQNIKSPSAAYKFTGDCKSRSLFITSVLKNLGIPYAYRFASYTGAYPYTHVYVIAKPRNGHSYIMDPDMVHFNIQKPTRYFIDYNMTQISYVSGANPRLKKFLSKYRNYRPGMLRLHNISAAENDMTDFDMELAIRKQREEIHKNIIERMSGIGCPRAEKAQDTIDLYNDLIEVRSDKTLSEAEKLEKIGAIMEDFDNGEYNVSAEVAGIGDIGKKSAKREARKQKRAAKRAAGKTFGQRLKKTAQKVVKAAGKVAKTVFKAATIPQRLAAKAVLEVLLPKAAPFFIYLFVRKPELIKQLPEKARKKRKIAERISQFIIKVIGMKEAHFMGIIRNGITKRYSQSPEQVLSKSLGMNINGIGDLGALPLIPILLTILQKLMQVFKKKAADAGGDLISDLKGAGEPDLKADFDSMPQTSKKSFARSVTAQPKSEFETAPGEESGGGGDSGDSGDSGDGTPTTNSRSSKLC